MAEKCLLELIKERIVFADGAMGTELFQRGVFVNTCYDELNITRPDLVKDIHDQYVRAGCDILETNTFGANEIKLAKFGLIDKVEEINISAVEIAKKAAASDVYVAGSIGPIGISLTNLKGKNRKHIFNVFSRQIRALVTGGVDLVIFETFSNPQELMLAISAAEDACDIPIIAQMAFNEHNETAYGNTLESSMAMISESPSVNIVGLNCSVGPSAMLESLKLLRSLTDKPISVQPNAGLPREIDGRKIYMSNPEYFAEYGKRFFEKGARIIGGCCGTTPEHIKELIKTVSAVDKAMEQKPKRSIVTIKQQEKSKGSRPLPLSERSRIGSKIASGRKFSSIEIVPPRGIDFSQLEEKARLCADYGIDAMNVPDGPRATSRQSPLVTAFKIQHAADIEAILHVCCRDKNLISMQSDILGTEALDVKNVLLITGDPPKLGEYPDATAVFDLDSIALTSVVQNLNRGLDIAGNELGDKLSLTVGVGANPVASDIEREIERFRQKADAGAEYAITQPVFDTKMLFDFMDEVSDCNVPVVAGIWPFTSYKNAEFMANEVPGVVVPQALLDRMNAAKTKEQGRQIGIQIAMEMIEQVRDRVAGFAVSAPFGNVRIALAALGKLKIEEV